MSKPTKAKPLNATHSRAGQRWALAHPKATDEDVYQAFEAYAAKHGDKAAETYRSHIFANLPEPTQAAAHVTPLPINRF